jgi:cytosine/uracil/thiamine/allantoin permease
MRPLYDYSWFVGFAVSFVAYYVLMKLQGEVATVRQEVA